MKQNPKHTTSKHISYASAFVLTVGVVLGSLGVSGVASAGFGTGTPVLPPNNPPANETPITNGATGLGCGSAWSDPSVGNLSACTASYVTAFNAAMSQDNATGTLELPLNWSTLSNPQQQFVLANLIRDAYTLQPFVGISQLLNEDAQQGANAGTDPSFGGTYIAQFDAQVNAAGGSNVAGSGYWGGGGEVLPMLWLMMYDDGCSPPGTVINGGCPNYPWGHRDGILLTPSDTSCSHCSYYYGTAQGAPGNTGAGSIAAISAVVTPASTNVPIVFSWAQEQQYLPACEQNNVDTCTALPPCPVNATTGVSFTAAFCVTTPTAPTAPIVGMAPISGGNGYYEVASNGAVYAYGGAPFYGSMAGKPLNEPIVGMASTPDGKGYWLVASDGGIFSFGTGAKFYGSMGGKPLNKPIVGIAPNPSGGGYYEVASDGGIFSFGSAPFFGSTGSMTLNKPIVGMTTTPTGGGYWMVASDGGIFAYGNAKFYGSMGGKPLNKPVVGMAATPSGSGYWEVASDGGVFSFGSAPFYGSTGSMILNKPIAGMAAGAKGYWFDASDGGIFAYNEPYLGSANDPQPPGGTAPVPPSGP